MADIAAIAARLDEAALGARAIAQITGQEGELPLAEAYEIQRAAIDRRLARGATLVGVKMGFTSEAKMIQSSTAPRSSAHASSTRASSPRSLCD